MMHFVDTQKGVRLMWLARGRGDGEDSENSLSTTTRQQSEFLPQGLFSQWDVSNVLFIVVSRLFPYAASYGEDRFKYII